MVSMKPSENMNPFAKSMQFTVIDRFTTLHRNPNCATSTDQARHFRGVDLDRYDENVVLHDLEGDGQTANTMPSWGTTRSLAGAAAAAAIRGRRR